MGNNVAVKPLSRKDIRDLARRFRKQFKLEGVFKFPIVQFIEWVLPVVGFDYDIISEKEMKNVYGLTDTQEGMMRIRQDVYEGAIAGEPRDRFTLCHELGHFLLHSPDRVGFARGKVPKYMDPEWQADAFAGELMAPYDLVKNMSVDEIAEWCGMSHTAAMVQYNFYHRNM